MVDSGLRAAYFRQQGGEENINLQAIQNGKKINLKETNVCGSKIKLPHRWCLIIITPDAKDDLSQRI